MRRELVLLFLIACKGGAGSIPEQDPGAPSPTSTGTTDEPAPIPTTAPTGTGSADRGGKIDATTLTKIVVSRSICGGVAGYCGGQSSATITFGSPSKLEQRSCVQDAGDNVTTRDLTNEEVDRIKAAVGKLRTSTDPDAGPLAYDGQMQSAKITNAAGEVLISPQPTCNHAAYTIVTEGWTEFYAAASFGMPRF